MEVEFVKTNPTQNMTILVTSPVDRKYHAAVAGKIMAYDSVYAEQVGFVEKPDNPQAAARLQMAGGEFCVNASLSLCAYLVWNGTVECDGQCTVPIESSGTNGILHCRITQKDGYFLGKIDVPAPESIKNFDVTIDGAAYTLPVVYMPGISHIIAATDELGVDKETVVETVINNYDSFTKEDALGIMFYDKAACAINPFVCVKHAGTKVWERGCGSGSAALGAYLAHTAGKNIIANVRQPGGVITVEANVDTDSGTITSISVEGKIEIAAYGKALCYGV